MSPMIRILQNAFSKINSRALKIALLSTFPGLGQLFNGRRDKALAFFAANLATAIFFSALLSWRHSYINHSLGTYYYCLSGLYAAWQPGTLPFTILEGLLLLYVLYAQYDAYKDACCSKRSGLVAQFTPRASFCLYQSVSSSYIGHVSAFVFLAFFISCKITPEIRPLEDNQIYVDFELNSSQYNEEKSAKGSNVGNAGQESNINETAHLRDSIKDDIRASTSSAEIHASTQESVDNNPAAEETEAVASKEIVSPAK